MSENKDKKSFSILDKLPFMKKLKEVKYSGIIIAIIFILILIFILFGNFNIFGTSSKVVVNSTTSDAVTYQTTSEYVEKLEKKLTSLLSKVKGAGDVEVMISVKSGSGISIVENTETTTKTSNGSEVTTVSTSPILIDMNGTSYPIIKEEILPEISGVVVVSSGADNFNVKMYLISAVQTLLDLSQDKIQILVGK